jgi:GTPase
MNNTVAIVGRPNVGKSTLFNRLVGGRPAIVDDVSGVTRDRMYGISNWNGKTFNLIDTGGFVKNSDDIFEKEIRKQVKLAMDEANVILFVVDVTVGITDLEEEITAMLRRSKKNVLLVVNKVDNSQRQLDASEFYKLGFEKVFNLSSISGSGTGELLDEVVLHIDESDDLKIELPKIAIVGQPNVGKSSMLNALLGEERNIVTDIPGTTRDSIHTHYKLFQKDFLLIDTAGIRKKGKVDEDIEFYSVIRAIKAIDEADVCILMTDAKSGIQAQDMQILNTIEKKRKGVVLVVNKWDLIEKETMTMKEVEKEILFKIAPFTDVPIIFTSVKEKQRIHKVVEKALEVFENKTCRISTHKLNEVMLKAIEAVAPPAYRGALIQIKYVTQLPVGVPTFAFFCNYPDHVKESYKSYLENQLRKNFSLSGVPINIFFRKK